MIGNSDEMYEKQISSMDPLQKTKTFNIEHFRSNSPSLKYFLDEEKNLEKFCTEKVFKHVLTKKNLFESKNCKSLIRSGVPLKYMSEIILKLLNIEKDEENFEIKHASIMKNHKSENFGDYVPYFTGLKTFKESLPIHYLNQQGILKLKEILWILNSINPNIEFSPLIIKVASLLSLFCTQSEVFLIMKSLIDLNFNVDKTFKIRWHLRFSFVDNNKIITSICESLQDISNKSGKETFQHFENINFPAEKLYEDMVYGFFMEYLNLSAILRLLPFYLLEGVKSLYRMCYAIVKYLRPMILQIKNPDDVIKIIREKSKEITDTNKLFNLAYSYKLTSKNNKYDFQKPSEKDLFANRRNSYYLPSFPQSTIIGDLELLSLWTKLPDVHRAKDGNLIFDPSKHGYSIKNIYNLTQNNEYSSNIIFLLETENNEVFGGFISNLFRLTGGKFEKPSESFMIKIRPKLEVCYPMKNSESILFCDQTFIMFGNGEKGPALYISEDVGIGRTNGENCFCKDPLVEAEDGNFKIRKFEIFLLY